MQADWLIWDSNEKTISMLYWSCKEFLQLFYYLKSMDSGDWARFIESFDSLDSANKMLFWVQKTVHFQVSM